MMENIDALQQKIFEECMEVLQVLAHAESREELVSKNYLVSDLFQHISFLELLEKNRDSLTGVVALQNIDNQYLNSNSVSNLTDENIPVTNDISPVTIPLIENADESTEQSPDKMGLSIENEVVIDDISNDEAEIKDEKKIEQPEFSEELIDEEIIAESVINEDSYERAVEIKEQEMSPEESDNKHDKKFKIANIKGLNKNIQSLFDDDEYSPAETKAGSAARVNASLNEMEVPKPRPDFKLDLNDRIAFSQNLFGGSQNDLNETINNLNIFNNLDDAKEYLSDIYYKKNWAKADAYAQRLWTLVENKFL